MSSERLLSDRVHKLYNLAIAQRGGLAKKICDLQFEIFNFETELVNLRKSEARLLALQDREKTEAMLAMLDSLGVQPNAIRLNDGRLVIEVPE